MNFVDLVAILALIQMLVFGALVGRARARYGVKAPAISGHELFERAYRIQMNTLEVMIVFIPALYLATKHWSPVYVATCGSVYLIGRVVYWRSYMNNPESRSLGFLLSIIPVFVLILASLVGLATSIT